MDNHQLIRRLLYLAIVSAFMVSGCRPTFDPPIQDTTGEGGGAGDDYTVQCSGWFPDWIARAAPPGDVEAFRLAQGYPLGVPVVNDDGEITGWDPLSPFDSAPWLAFDFTDPAERASYLEALKDYALSDLVPHDFVPQNHTLGKKRWYHVPMMTSGFFPASPAMG
ncbi:hypothetical protein EHN06_12350 [Marinobacter sp. NP-4(2019)]|uniref:hypothetical protein n=1 Tax=Marinobacter sp. NP-4(2019) TaxID=2488665 RepID=UPI000FC3D592|nr:hypothetical protein [Marinobacter sp. NP-4(2019)]AZT84267.1 hypothetical protein EHN06_12350 [Marinobacter sp. NP-4(2019)]